MTVTADVKITIFGNDTFTLCGVDKNEYIAEIYSIMKDGDPLHIDSTHLEALIGPDALRSAVVMVENIQGTDDDTNT